MSKSSSDCYRNMKQTAGHAPPMTKAPGIPLPLLPKRVLKHILGLLLLALLIGSSVGAYPTSTPFKF